MTCEACQPASRMVLPFAGALVCEHLTRWANQSALAWEVLQMDVWDGGCTVPRSL